MTPFHAIRLARLCAPTRPTRLDRRRADHQARLRFRPQWGLMALEDRRLLSSVFWSNSHGGDWDNPINWSTDKVPGASDDVTINVPGITVTHALGNQDAVHSLTSQDALNISSGSLSIGAASTISKTLSLSGATLSLAGNLTVSGLFTWGASAINGTGSVTMTTGGVAITGDTHEQVILDRVTLDNTGTGSWSGTANFVFADGAVFNNQAGASFTVQSDQSIFTVQGAAGVINNAGTFTKNSTTGTTTADGVAFNNTSTGTVNVSSGKLALDGGGTSNGAFHAASGALDLGGGVSLGAAATVSGSNISFSFGTNTDAGPLTSTSSLSFISGGTTTLTGTVNTSGATVTIANATADFDTNLIAPTIDLSGTLGGTGAVSVSSALNWNGGTINGPRTVTVPKGATLAFSLGPQEILDGATLNNAGTATWSGSDAIFLADGAVFNNQAGASFTMQTDRSIDNLQGAAGVINNAGTFTKNSTTGTTLIAVAFNNTGGTVNAQTGTITLGGGGTDTGGTLSASKGATIDLTGGSTITMTGTYRSSGAGTVALKSGTLNIGAGGATFNLAGSLFQWTGGTLNLGANTLTIASTATLNVAGSAAQSFSGTGSLVNQGTISYTGTGGLTITQPLDNTGTLAVHNATVTVSGPVTQVSSGTLTAGKWEVFGSSTVHATLSITTAGSVITTIGSQATVELSGLDSTFNNVDGLATNQGSFIVAIGRTFTTAGNWSNSGNLTLSGGTLTITGTVAQLSGTSLTGGTWTVNANSSLNFHGGSDITSLAGANVTLNGASANFAALANLATIGSTSSFSVLGGRTFTTTGNSTDSGRLTLGPASSLAVHGSFTETSTGKLTIQIGGTASAPTVGLITTGASGMVTLAGTLAVTSTVILGVGTRLTILNNQGNSAISGTFAGLPEGSTFTVTVGGTKMTLKISYVGGTGNDVTLTRIS
jgi:hypothetical protein